MRTESSKNNGRVRQVLDCGSPLPLSGHEARQSNLFTGRELISSGSETEAERTSNIELATFRIEGLSPIAQRLSPTANIENRTRRRSPASRAFSLIELIGVLAVIAILATALAPSFVRQIDKTSGDQESAALKSLSDALQRSIMRSRYIPNEADWAPAVANELGMDITTVTNSPRMQPRLFLIDPALQVGVNGRGLPYSQTSAGSAVTNNAGAVIPPVSPRVMILSSIGRALPAGLVSGVPSAANFTNIWNSTDGTVPAAPVFSGWAGSGEDLKVQRIDLSPLFVELQLSKLLSSSSCCCPSYSIDLDNLNSARPVCDVIPDWPGYFIQNSILYLYNGTNNPNPAGGYLDSQQILIRNNTFTYDQNVWRGSIGGEAFLAGLDIASAVDRYLAAYPNVRAANGTNQQAIVVQKMIDFMDRYSDWSAANFPYDNQNPPPTYSAVVNAQAAMIAAVQGQYRANGNNPNPVNCQ